MAFMLGLLFKAKPRVFLLGIRLGFRLGRLGQFKQPGPGDFFGYV
jgi:hypothetical protein